MAGALDPQSTAAPAGAAIPAPFDPDCSGPAQAIGRVRDLVATVLDPIRFGVLSDADAVAVLGAVEDLGRRVDAARVGAAAEVGSRARNGLGHDSLAWKLGCQGQVDLITRVTRVSGREAARRLRLGGNVTDRMSGTMLLPPYYPAVAAGLTTGALGVDAAEAIVAALDQVSPRVAPDDLHTAERALVASGTGAITDEIRGLPGEGFAFPADLVRGLAGHWQARLDPDGAAPNESLFEPRSTVSFGRLTRGVYPLRGLVTADLRGILNGVFDTYLSAHAAPAFPTSEEQARIQAGALIPGADTAACTDERTGGEKRADILRGVFSAAARHPSTPKMGGAAPTVMVHVNASDLLGDTGVGWIDGVEAPVSLRSVKQLICTGGYRKILFGEHGEVLYLGGKERFFTAAQRKAIAARDGGCIIPGCPIAAHWCEVHHVIPWQKHGKTNVDNGVLLCWYHHHSIDTSGWQIRMIRGKPEVKAPAWAGTTTTTWHPGATHRAQQPTHTH
ncbi:HNH endonuclease, partial [Cryobacterium algoritolerans]